MTKKRSARSSRRIIRRRREEQAMKLAGKRVLITGGTSGIGLALAHALIAKGARVFITGRRQEVLDAALRELKSASGVAADVATGQGRSATLNKAIEALGGLDILINNAGGVRAGRLENTSEAEIETMVAVDLLAPILLTRAALPALRASGETGVVNVSSGIALVGAPFYATYAAVKAGLAHFGEALRRELKGEGIHVMTAYPGGTDTPMMKSNRAGPELGFSREPASAVAQAIIEGIEANAFEVIRGGEARAKMIALNRDDPAAVDARFLDLKPALEEAVKDHAAL
jgi:short-subunit dehydrogenase